MGNIIVELCSADIEFVDISAGIETVRIEWIKEISKHEMTPL